MTADNNLLEHNPPDKAAACMILLHGLGASGDDLFPLANELGGLRVVCPNAAIRAVTLNGGWKMRAWYDIRGLNLEDRQDVQGVKESQASIENLLAAEKARGFAANKIFLAGFSQGAAMAVYTGLRHVETLAGVIALSGYLLFGDALAGEATVANRETPIFQAHGAYDTVVLPPWAQSCHQQLSTGVGPGGWPVEYREYPMAHAIIPAELADLNRWLKKQIAVIE